MTMVDLVGIPWQVHGRDTSGIDCVGLALLAQDVMCGRRLHFGQEYTAEDLGEKSQVISAEIVRYFVPCGEPCFAGVGVFEFPECLHVGTFVSRTHFLHIFEQRTSRISRLTPVYKRYLKEVYAWPEQQ